MLMIIAIPAGLAMAFSGLFTHTVARSFDAEPPARWTARRHAREYASFAVMTLWVVALLMAGEAVLRFENGQETLRLLLIGAGIAALGGVPALLAAGRGWTRKQPV